MDPTETGKNLDSQQPCLPNSRHPERPERAQCWTTRCARIPEAHKPTSKNLSKIYMWMVVWTASRDISPPLRTGKSSLKVKPYAACTMDHSWNKCKKNLPKMLGRPPGGVCWPNKKMHPKIISSPKPWSQGFTPKLHQVPSRHFKPIRITPPSSITLNNARQRWAFLQISGWWFQGTE